MVKTVGELKGTMNGFLWSVLNRAVETEADAAKFLEFLSKSRHVFSAIASFYEYKGLPPVKVSGGVA
jgi:hypothetical protein